VVVVVVVLVAAGDETRLFVFSGQREEEGEELWGRSIAGRSIAERGVPGGGSGGGDGFIAEIIRPRYGGYSSISPLPSLSPPTSGVECARV
jgi:hypothetical protein